MKRLKTEVPAFYLTFYEKLYVEKETNISYGTFKKTALERMRLLRKIENNVRDLSGFEDLFYDLTSHFYLRLVASQAQWSLIWFVNQETALFKLRLGIMKDHEIMNFFNKSFIVHYKNDDDTKLLKTGSYDPDYTVKLQSYDFIHFTKCSDSIHKRRNILQRGFLPLNRETTISLLCTEFKTFLETNCREVFEHTAKHSDERLIKLNADLFQNYNTTFETSSTNTIADIVNSAHLPLCMKLLLNRLNSESHLKFHDRNQLVLFLKDLKIPINETMNFMRAKLPRMKEKELTYNIRHNYGLEGKRGNYSCFSCQKIIGNSTDANSTGCPFVKNKSYAAQFVDLEDLDATKNCKKYLGKLIEISKIDEINMRSPVDFFKAAENFKKKSEK
ncbi:DNA pol primase large subfamily [Nucleospora cyclopteri]